MLDSIMQKKYMTYNENLDENLNFKKFVWVTMIEQKTKTDSNALSEVHRPDTLSTGLGWYLTN